MKFSKFNHEGYYDPTAYQAFTNIEEEKRTLEVVRPNAKSICPL